MTSTTITLSGDASILTAHFFPPLEMDGQFEYECGLIDFQSFHSIPNVDVAMNTIFLGNEEITIPTGTYEIDAISQYINKHLDESEVFNIFANKNTLHCEITSSLPVDFTKDNTIAPLLGFSNIKLDANKTYISDKPANIFTVSVIRIECDIIQGSYFNGKKTHTLHEFFPRVSPGYKIIESPQNVIYFPITKSTIDSITLTILDQNHQLINFRKENITARIHIKRIIR